MPDRRRPGGVLRALLMILPGTAAQRGGPPNESDQLPTLTTPVRIAPDFTIRAIQTNLLGASYPRVIQLQHCAAEKGQLLLTYAGGSGAMPVYRSVDDGETFQPFSELKDLRGQPTLYELPAKMPGYALEPRSNPVYFKVCDDGLNWGDPKHPGTL